MTAESAPLPREAAALFHGAPEGFVAARDALATRLREQGRAEDASAVKRLRKPTVVAWALDQLVTRDPDGVHALLEAGAEVRAAQQAALSSKRGAAERLRSAGIARAAAVTHLAAVAATALREAGKDPDSHADAITGALSLSAIDHESATRLAAGTFERPPTAEAGFGDVFGLTAIEGGDTEEAPAARTTDRADLAELRHDIARLRRDRDAAARRARKAAEAADGFAHELEGMRRRLEVIERKHAEAASKAAAGSLEVTRAERALRRAMDRLESLGDT